MDLFMKNHKIRLASPDIGKLEIQAVTRVMKSKNLAQGPEVLKFENLFSKHVSGLECIAVNSGTSALLLALLALEIGKGDEVIVPSFTFAATANAVVLAGGTPIFADIDEVTFNIDIESIRSRITTKTRAIIAVHLYGLAADMVALSALCKEKGLFLIEDAAQAHLASIDGVNVGTFGDVSAFSFYPTKNMTTGEGGMVVAKDPKVARHVRLLRNQGMEVKYQNEIAGFNMRMTDISAAIGVVQLGKIERLTKKRRSNAEFYIQNLPEKVTPKSPSGYFHVYHQFTLRVKDRDSLIEVLKASNIESAVYYPTLVHSLPAYKLKIDLPNSQKISEEVVSIPVHPDLTKKDLRKVVSVISDFLRHND
jgi:dTDP-4-amino-4,6-dideoxygalactose transaminase